MNKIRIAIAGYGNLGRGVENSIKQNPDMELVAVVSRRSDIQIDTKGIPVVPVGDIKTLKDQVDVLVLCGGSATDLPQQTPEFTQWFNTVDSYDNHSKIPEHFSAVDAVAKENGKVSVISVGWDPGMFSVNRLYSECILPSGSHYTFWGRGVSQGHSDAIRRVEGVLDARQYTVPVPNAIEAVRSGSNPTLSTREKHTRECYVVAAPGADLKKIESEIVSMPAYFADYDTTVTFISQEELNKNHSEIPHGGFVIRSGDTGKNKHIIEYALKLDSNPEFTASVMTAYARAAYRLCQKGQSGCYTCFDIAPALLSIKTAEELRREML